LLIQVIWEIPEELRRELSGLNSKTTIRVPGLEVNPWGPKPEIEEFERGTTIMVQ
jgi:hypothetical protein